MGPPFLRIGVVDVQAMRHWRAEGLEVIEGFGRQVAEWSLDRRVCVGHIHDDASLADALEAASRGASLAVTVIGTFTDALCDDALRAGLHIADDSGSCAPSGPSLADRQDAGGGPADAVGSTEPEWAALLALLAEGLSVAQAARACHISLRSAYRRLDTARTYLGVASTTAAVVTWRSRCARSTPGSTSGSF